MNRRNFLQSASLAVAGLTLAKAEPLFAGRPQAESWRRFEVTTVVEVLNPVGETKIWLPTALIRNTPFQKTLSNHYSADARMVASSDPQALGIVVATFPGGVKPMLTLASEVQLKNYSVDLSKPGKAQPLTSSEAAFFLQPHQYVPTDES